MVSERIRLYFDDNKLLRIFEGDGFDGVDAPTHITLPLNAALLDDAAVEAAARVLSAANGKPFDQWSPKVKSILVADAESVIAAYAAHVAGGGA